LCDYRKVKYIDIKYKKGRFPVFGYLNFGGPKGPIYSFRDSFPNPYLTTT
jgi:hypothetical protein